MKLKIFLILSLILTISISLPSFTYLSMASQTASVSLSPAVISSANMSVGSTFTVSVQVSGISNVFGWTMSLSWDPKVLQMQDTPSEGSFLKTVGSTIFIAISPNNTLGIDKSLNDVFSSNLTASGSGTLARMVFTVVSLGSCQISMNNTEFDTNGTPDAKGDLPTIPVTLSDATFTTSPAINTSSSSTHGPVASFSPAEGSTFKTGTTVTLDSSSSQPGYDTQTQNINNYAWRVEYLNGTTFASLTGKTATFNASVEGTFKIILIVTANDTQTTPDPNYVNTDSTTATINIISNVQLVNIDVFTDKGGPNGEANGGAYGPLQLLQMYASVTYNSASMPYENVIFSVLNSNGSVILVRQGFTNQTGIASASFRLPTPDPSAPQNSFGTWSIMASVNVTDISVSANTNFTFTYQSGIENIIVPSSINRLENLPIQLTINNAFFTAQWSQLSITLFDQSGEPIGSTTVTTPQQTQNITVIDTSINIPPWAFTGQATAYFCLLTNSTSTQAIPLAPETVATFQILP